MDLPNTSNDLSICLLGNFRVMVGERTIPETVWSLRKAKNVIKLLALAPGHRMHRLQLVELLWPESSPQVAASNLHKILYVVRHALEPGISRRQPSSFLLLRDDIVILTAPGNLWIDFEAFQAVAAEAQKAQDVAMHEEALTRYAGEFLPEDQYEEWAIRPRGRHLTSVLSLLLGLAELRAQHGDPEGAVEALRQVIVREPAHEEAHLALMTLLAEIGQRHQALRQYQQLCDVLQSELGVDPSPGVEARYRQIANGELESSIAETRGAAPQQQAPSPASLHSSEVPLVGRQRELDSFDVILDVLRAGRGGLVMVDGEAGIGKSRLAAEVSARARDRGAVTLWGAAGGRGDSRAYGAFITALEEYSGRADMVYLRSLLDAEALELGRLVPAIARILGRQPGEVPSPDDEQSMILAVSSFLTRLAADTPVLVVLDDVHRADADTLLLLQLLVESARNLPLLFLGLYRAEEVPPGSRFDRLLSGLEGKGFVQCLSLPVLGLLETEYLVTHLLGGPTDRSVLRWIHAVAKGNPHYICDMTRALVGRGHLACEEGVWRLQAGTVVVRDRSDLRRRTGDQRGPQIPGHEGGLWPQQLARSGVRGSAGL